MASRKADAVPAPAGAIGQRPGAEGDEPQPHASTAICKCWTGCARCGPTSRCRAISSSASPAKPMPSSRRRCAGRCSRLCPVLQLQVFAPPRHACRDDGRAGAAAVMDERLQRLAGRAQPRASWRSIRPRSAHAARCWSSARASCRAMAGQVALAAIGAFHRRSRDRRSGRGRTGRSRRQLAFRTPVAKSRPGLSGFPPPVASLRLRGAQH
jgi:hypothetical protein